MTNLQHLQSLTAKEMTDYLYYEVYNTGYYDGEHDTYFRTESCNFEQTEEWLNSEWKED